MVDQSLREISFNFEEIGRNDFKRWNGIGSRRWRIENEMASASRTVIDMSKVEEEACFFFFFFYAKRQSVRELDTCVGVDNVVTPFKRCKVKAVCAKQTIFELIERRPRGRIGSRSRDRARR